MPTVKNPLAVRKPPEKNKQVPVKPVSLGRTVATPAVLNAVPFLDIMIAMERHKRHDWGDVCEADWKENDRALKTGERLLSAYKSGSGTKFWIITEWDRSVTTVLLPSDY
nr:hypothetical protein [uncultured Oscillibacter sp.]